jgi:hypothetical protein
MTGQVKEDILSRFGELGVFVTEGKLYFDPCLLRQNEFLQKDRKFNYVNIAKVAQEVPVQKGSLAFTYCQVPIVYTIADEYGLTVHLKDGHTKAFENLSLDVETSQHVFDRAGEVIQINVNIKSSHLK